MARCGISRKIKNSIKLIESFLAAGKPVALVCHAPGALRHVRTPNGKPLVEGKNVTGFTDGEEEEMGLTKVVPFLVGPGRLRANRHAEPEGEIAGPLTSGRGHAARIVLRVSSKSGPRRVDL